VDAQQLTIDAPRPDLRLSLTVGQGRRGLKQATLALSPYHWLLSKPVLETPPG
jgi:hypothetical protein